jgi:adhesin transport system outer membrane protein
MRSDLFAKWMAFCLVAGAAHAFATDAKNVQLDVIDFQGMLKLGLERHPTIRQQQALLAAKDFQTTAAEGQRLPSFGVEASRRSDSSNSSALTGKMPIITFGRIDADIEVAKAESEVEKIRIESSENQLVEKLSNAYINYLGLVKKLRVAQVSLREQKQLLDRIQRRSSTGYSSDADQRSISSRVTQAISRAQDLEIKIEEKRKELSNLLGIEIRQLQPINQDIFDTLTTANWKEELAQKNIDLQILQLQFEVLKKQQEQVRLSDRPTVNLTGAQPIGKNTATGSSKLAVGVEFKYEFNSMGKAKSARLQQYESLKDAKQEELQAATMDLTQKISVAWTNIASIEKTLIPTQRNLIEDLDANIEAFQRQFLSGRKSLFELLNAHKELSEAKNQLIDYEIDQLSRKITIASSLNKLKTLAQGWSR